MTTTARPRVGIVGLGTIGSMTAWQAAARGFDVTVFESFWPGHNEGAAAGGTRMFRRVYAEGATYGPLVDEAWRMWRELEYATGEDILFRTGGLSIGPANHPVLSGGLADAQDRGLPYEILDAEALAARYPQHRLLPGELALFDPEAGVLRSNVAVAAATAEARRLGATLRLNETVLAVEDTATGARIVSENGSETFDHVVIAGGPWAQNLLPDLPLETRAIFHTWHLVKNRQLLRPERFPITLRRSGPDLSYGLMSALDGSRIKLAPHFDYARGIDDVAELDRHVRHEWQRVSIELVEKLLPGVEPGPVEAGIFPESFSPDGHAAVGPVDPSARIVVLAGFSGHGFKLAPAFGRAAVDVLETGSSALLPSEVDLHRDYRAQVSIRDLVLNSEPA